MFRHIAKFIKNEIVFCVAAVIAAISAFFVRPSKDYISYIDFRVLALLLCLMLVVAGFRKLGAFEYIINHLLKKIRTAKVMEIILILITFFTSMLITNDVALITFVPFSVLLLTRIEMKKHIIYIVALQTIAANLGSMVTPIGNPQNLYLYTTFHINITEFFSIMWLPSLISLILLVIMVLPLKNSQITASKGAKIKRAEPLWHIAVYTVLFTICILCVLKVVDYRVMLSIVLLSILIICPKLFAKADYMLLLTFIMFFIFVGNMKQIPEVRDAVNKILKRHEIIVSVGTSQIISNVPAAVLLSGFTNNVKALLLGTNIGGLGTIIASMASLISFRIYQAEKDARKGKYLIVFTVLNVVFLLVLLAVVFLLER